MEPKSKILAVDDSPTNVAVMQEMLGEEYTLKTAASGEEALEIANDFRPDITLLDIMMPGIDGYEVCRRMRATPSLRQTKIIMVSAKALVSERLEGYAAGADDYITKPFAEDELQAKIRVYLRLKNVEEVDQLKNGVVSLLGHEMRSQINGILLPTTLLMSDEDMAGVERKMLADMVYRNIKRLHGLLEDIVGEQRHNAERRDGATAPLRERLEQSRVL
ncbi:MAG: response regulator [Phycisphaerae bacterium]